MRQMKSGILKNNLNLEKCAIVTKIQLILIKQLNNTLKDYTQYKAFQINESLITPLIHFSNTIYNNHYYFDKTIKLILKSFYVFLLDFND